MELPRSSESGSGNCGDFAPGMAETLQFREEIRSLMAETDLQQQSFDSPPENGSSFKALLELPMNQAIELLHEPGTVDCPAIGSARSWRDPPADRKQVAFSSFNYSPTFHSNAALVERAATFSVFAAEESAAAAQTSSDPSNGTEISSVKLKTEPADSDLCLNSSPNFVSTAARQRSGKRKGVENKKVKAPAKRGKNVEDGSSKTGEESKGSEKLPYVHVRARRGQATDSHSLAERARREKINARMKLLQELVPGCNKISGTALVLDEIINHVQSLQRQVEFLSMRLAAVNPRIDFSGLNSFFTTDNGDLATGDLASMVAMDPLLWSQLLVNGAGRHQQQFWHPDLLSSWQKDDNNAFITPESTLLDYNSTNSVAQHPNQLKTEL
ncbi:hypothetical protein AAC387_Pa02g3019 [Persea americana]